MSRYTMTKGMRDTFRKEAPELLDLAESFDAGADDRWHISGVATGPGWWGVDTGFWIATVVDNPGWSGRGYWAVFWVGERDAQVKLLTSDEPEEEFSAYEWMVDAHYRISHDNLRAYLDNLPRPIWAYGVEEVDGE